MAYTVYSFEKKFLEKFGVYGLSVLNFRGSMYPLDIHCPKHGNQTVSNATSCLCSKLGCPACGREHQQSKASERLKQSNKSAKPLLILDTTTNETLTFPSVTAAGTALGVHFQQINHRLKGRTSPDNLISNRYKVLGYDR